MAHAARLHYIALHCIPLHCIPLLCIPLLCCSAQILKAAAAARRKKNWSYLLNYDAAELHRADSVVSSSGPGSAAAVGERDYRAAQLSAGDACTPVGGPRNWSGAQRGAGGGGGMSPYHTNVASYKAQLVALKVLRVKHHFPISRSLKENLQLMKDLNHENINKFVGACIPSIHFISNTVESKLREQCTYKATNEV